MSLRERFDAKWVPEPNTGCWLWTASLNKSGRAQCYHRGRVRTGGRVAWELYRGEDPGDRYVLHKCNNRACINPDHLYLGTQKDNMVDMARAGRQHRQRLSAAAVREIRALSRCGVTGVDLAKFYGVRTSTVSRVLSGKRWAWLEGANG